VEPGSREGLVNRDAAIEAGGRALRSAMYPDVAERLDPLPVSPNWLHIAAAVIDAATPHLVGEPVGYAALRASWNGEPERILAWTPDSLDVARHVAARATDPLGYPIAASVVALTPIEDQP
jgi:hypothetical protein